jgi:hypothetical protein
VSQPFSWSCTSIRILHLSLASFPVPFAAPSSDSCIDIRDLTQQLQRAHGMGASIVVGAFAAGAFFLFLLLHVLYSITSLQRDGCFG